MATGQATIVIPCPYAWAERHLRDYKDRKLKTHGAREDLLDHAHANIAQTIDSIAGESSTHNPIGMGAKHPKQQTNQDQHHKDSEQHVPQFIVENFSFMAMATCQFTATTPRSRNNKNVSRSQVRSNSRHDDDRQGSQMHTYTHLPNSLAKAP